MRREKPRSRASALRSMGNAQPASAPEPSGQASARAAAEANAFGVAEECFAVREQPVRKQQRLRVLHVSGARHGNAEIFLGLVCDRARQGGERLAHVASRILYIHAKLGRDHFVAAAAGVKLRAERAELFDERALDKMVNVLGFGVIEPGGVRLRAELDIVERGHDLLAFFVREDSGGRDGASPGAVERKFLGQQAAIEMPGAFEFVEGSVRAALEAPAPHFLVSRGVHFTSAAWETSLRAGR